MRTQTDTAQGGLGISELVLDAQRLSDIQAISMSWEKNLRQRFSLSWKLPLFKKVKTLHWAAVNPQISTSCSFD